MTSLSRRDWADVTVTHISNYDVLGGASRAGYRLHRGLKAQGVASRMLVGQRTAIDEDISQIPRGPRLWHSLEWRLWRLLDRVNFGELAMPSSLRLPTHPWVKAADVLHLHKIHDGGFFPLLLLPHLSRRHVLVWTLHDVWSMSGYCYYPLDCPRWKTGCGRCPQVHRREPIPIRLADPPALDTTAALWRLKKSVFTRSAITVVTPSRWLATMVAQSPLMKGHPVTVIPNGLDTTLYRPEGREAGRSRYGFEARDKVILFIEGKGDRVFRAALDLLETRPGSSWKVLVIGKKNWTGSTLPVLTIPPIRDEQILAETFAAADVFVLPTFADNLPYAILESMSAGTPVVASDVGGVPEMVRPGESGVLAQVGNPQSFSEAIELLLNDDDQRVTLGRRAREIVLDEFSLDRQALAYMRLYEERLSARRTH